MSRTENFIDSIMVGRIALNRKDIALKILNHLLGFREVIFQKFFVI